jgi:hypothetical protein
MADELGAQKDRPTVTTWEPVIRVPAGPSAMGPGHVLDGFVANWPLQGLWERG